MNPKNKTKSSIRLVIILHCWGQTSQGHWYRWLAEKINQEFEVQVIIPDMPNSANPDLQEWLGVLNQIIMESALRPEEIMIVGHSIGAQTVLHYLSQLQLGQKLGAAVFVAAVPRWYIPEIAGFAISEQEIAKLKGTYRCCLVINGENDNYIGEYGDAAYTTVAVALQLEVNFFLLSGGHWGGDTPEGLTRQLPEQVLETIKERLWNHAIYAKKRDTILPGQ